MVNTGQISPEPEIQTTPRDNRQAQINFTRKQEMNSLRAYRAALEVVNACDPLSVGYDECQNRLRGATDALLEAREAHRLALAGVTPEV